MAFPTQPVKVPPPIIRQFIPCMGVRCDITVKPSRYDLENVFYVIQTPFGVKGKVVIEGVWILLQISDGDGTRGFAIDLAEADGSDVRRLKTFQVHLSDKLCVKNVAVKLPRFPCLRLGVYEFWLRESSSRNPGEYRDEEIIARAPFDLEEAK